MPSSAPRPGRCSTGSPCSSRPARCAPSSSRPTPASCFGWSEGMRILVAEDDSRIAQSLDSALAAAGFVVEIEADGENAWFRGDTEAFDAVVLDLGLPTLDGLTVLKR